MYQYFFILGRNATLSLAEIIAVLTRLDMRFQMEYFSPEIAVLSTDVDIDGGMLMGKLGGTIKIGKIVTEAGLDQDESVFERIFSADYLTANIFQTETHGKLHFGISIYTSGGDANILSHLTKELKTFNSMVKDNLKEKGVKAGFVQIKDRFLSSVSVYKNRLLTHGAEIVMIVTKQKILIGKTLAVQEFESFSFRDYQRPWKDKRSGIMPPKLARMLINLLSADEHAVLLDPFCGSGTVLQEAIMLGYTRLIGCDLNIKAVSDTKKNIDWLFQRYKNLNISSYNIFIHQVDVRKITQKIQKNSVDVVVTEPYLGPPLHATPSIHSIGAILSEVKKLYLETFAQMKEIVKSDGKIVFIFPAFPHHGRMNFVEIIREVEAIGFRQRGFFPNLAVSKYSLHQTGRNTILYGGEEQFVQREIISFQKA